MSIPAGGQQGATVELTVGGQFLDGVNEVYISGPGIQATVVEYHKPITQGQFNTLREKLKELTDKRTAATRTRKRGEAASTEPKPVWTPEDEKAVAEIRKKLGTFVRRPLSPALVETVTLKLVLAPGAALGERELRLGTPTGLTNPMVFCVGQLPEYSKMASKATNEPAVGKGARYRIDQKPVTSEAPLITLPTMVNGQIMPGGVDRYRFQATKGQRIVVAASARELIPYISDAVPGWFQATLGLFDSKGKPLAYADHYRFHPDPVIYHEIAQDGEYTIEIKDSIYRGREDFVYRIAAGELPYVTSIFPLGGKAGAQSKIDVLGWNLPAGSQKQVAKNKAAGLHPISVRKGEWVSNRAPFEVDTLPEGMDVEPNNQKERAQRIKLPLIVNGRINQSGDWDVFRFEGRAGEEIVAEVLARRLDSPLDSILKLTDAAGKQIAINDDSEDKGTGLLTHHADSQLRVTLPSNGTYYLHLGDTQNKGGAEYGYRLRVSAPQPDFELRMVPASINARAGMTIPITVYAMRRDGFAGDIALKLKDAPTGFILSGAWIPANQDKMRLTLTVPADRKDKVYRLFLEGHATIQGKDVQRMGVPAEDMMQAFAYRHLVPAQEWMAVAAGPVRYRVPWKLPTQEPVKLPVGGTVQVRVAAPVGGQASSIKMTLSEPPEGVTIQDVTSVPGAINILLRADAAKVKSGLKGNLIVDAAIEREDAKQVRRRQPLGTLPAIPFEIVSTIVARQ